MKSKLHIYSFSKKEKSKTDEKSSMDYIRIDDANSFNGLDGRDLLLQFFVLIF